MVVGYHRPAVIVAGQDVQDLLDHRHLLPQDRGLAVEDREADHLAVDLFERTFGEHGMPQVVHADSAPTMRSALLKGLLAEFGITESHNRPRVSNDNPSSESEFRTMKYRPNYPGTVTDLDLARAHMASYVPWYNAEHKHSGIALFSPDEVHNGTWRDRWETA